MRSTRLNDLILPKLRVRPNVSPDRRWTLELFARKAIEADQDEIKLKFLEKFLTLDRQLALTGRPCD